jgi:catechol 2,3-dioxygenase
MFRMPADVELTKLVLRVRDLDAALARYRDVLGLEVVDSDGATTTLGLGGWTLDLIVEPGAPLRPQPSVGMYHFALLVPDRPALAAMLRRLDEAGWPLDGWADHGVSEALYLRDAEGNAIEIYRDRPREEWPFVDGEIAMVADPLDGDAILATTLAAGPLHPDTIVGHIHMHAPDLGLGEAFYGDSLGFGVTQRTYFGALFLAAGDYHHHVGLNVWAHGRTAPPGATGLVSYTWRVSPEAVEGLAAHLDSISTPYRRDGDLVLEDPCGVTVRIAQT